LCVSFIFSNFYLKPSHHGSNFCRLSVGIHQRPGDLEVNVCKTKALTNMRSANKGITIGLTSSIEQGLDDCVEYIAADEILEVTQSKLRMCKNPAMAGKNKKTKK
jgi:GTP-binding protein